MVCKSELVRSSNVLDIVVQFKVKMELKTNNKIKSKDLMLPNIYIALVDRESEVVLAKMISKIDIRNKEDNLIVNKKNLGSNMQIMITYLYILDYNKPFISV